MKTKEMRLPALALGLLVVLGISPTASAAVAQATSPALSVHVDGRKVIVVKRRPPAPVVEVRTRRPSRRHVWVDGYWQHRGGRFVWVRGRWVVRPHGAAVYVRPTWGRRGNGWVLTGGYWR